MAQSLYVQVVYSCNKFEPYVLSISDRPEIDRTDLEEIQKEFEDENASTTVSQVDAKGVSQVDAKGVSQVEVNSTTESKIEVEESATGTKNETADECDDDEYSCAEYVASCVTGATLVKIYIAKDPEVFSKLKVCFCTTHIYVFKLDHLPFDLAKLIGQLKIW